LCCTCDEFIFYYLCFFTQRSEVIQNGFAYNWDNTGKGKAVQLEAWSGPEGSRKLRFPDYLIMAQDGGKVVGLTDRPPLPPGNAPGTNFC
jgi:hypothetical protein